MEKTIIGILVLILAILPLAGCGSTTPLVPDASSLPALEPTREGSSERTQTKTVVGEKPETTVQGFWELTTVTYTIIGEYYDDWHFLWQVGVRSHSPGNFLADVHIKFLDGEDSVVRHGYAVEQIGPYAYEPITKVTKVRAKVAPRIESIEAEVKMKYYPSIEELMAAGELD